MIDRTSMLAGGYLLPPGNGHPELHLDPLDPIDFVTAEINARKPDVAPVVEGAIKKALGYDELVTSAKGLAAAVALGIVGILALIFGGYLLTKDS